MCAKHLFASICLLGMSLIVYSSAAFALPWDIDMYRQQSYRSNEMARSPVKGTVPIGRKPFMMTVEEAERQLENPVAFTTNSVWHGRRLYNAQCSSCHGLRGDSKAPVGEILRAPDLRDELYTQRSDGRIFAVIHYGQGNMPRYGYKLSEEEKWNLVNYVRFLQGRDVEGIKRFK